jgi:hypothetical protein
MLVQISTDSFTAMTTPRMNPAHETGALAIETQEEPAPEHLPDETPDSNTPRKASSQEHRVSGS